MSGGIDKLVVLQGDLVLIGERWVFLFILLIIGGRRIAPYHRVIKMPINHSRMRLIGDLRGY